MPYTINCSDKNCLISTTAYNIVDLVDNYRDKDGWFKCSCGQKGYIEKNFELQEKGQTWEPYLHGAISLGDIGASYQPFVYMVSNSPEDFPNAFWFSYYKDMRTEGGRLKLGHGPGGPPVLGKDALTDLIIQLVKLNVYSKEELIHLLDDDSSDKLGLEK